MKNFGLPTGILRRQNAAEELEAYKESGMECIEVHADFKEVEIVPSILPNASLHLPGRQTPGSVRVELARGAIEAGYKRVIIHPNHLDGDKFWASLGGILLVENLDPRNPEWRDADDLARAFEMVPNAGMCLDVAHAAKEPEIIVGLIERYHSRIKQVHLSEICYESGRHQPGIDQIALENAVAWLDLLPRDIPVIVELAGELTWDEAVEQVRCVAELRHEANDNRLVEPVDCMVV